MITQTSNSDEQGASHSEVNPSKLSQDANNQGKNSEESTAEIMNQYNVTMIRCQQCQREQPPSNKCIQCGIQFAQNISPACLQNQKNVPKVEQQTVPQQLNLNNNSAFRLYFLKGCDNRQLNLSQQKEFLNYVKIDPYGHSFMIYNSNELKNKVNQWKQALPWITPYYAIKSNPIDPILKVIVDGPYGTFDCASKGEISTVIKSGVPGSKIVYSNPVKEEKDIQYAKSMGVEITSADTIDELIKIQKIAPEMKILWRISIVEENPEQMATVFSGKFGDDIPDLDAAHKRFQQIQQMGIQLHGIHFHCGSAVQGSSSFGKAIDLAKECMKIGRLYGHKMILLDVGGGFPTGNIQENIINALKKTENDPLGYEVIAEPGRHFSANTCYLLFRIMTKRIKHGRLCYHVNESLYHSFNCVLMDGITFENENDQLYSVFNSDGSQNTQNSDHSNVSIFGMTCDGHDALAKNITLPSDMQVGDWLCMSGMGSYTIGPKSRFNGMKSTSKIYQWSSQIEEQI
ncbi:unnamed protein product (macronuclear) [Paramecium tetraurelia]|uniref:Orn/DAP/Arg decarboxylase 2 N-terminal domain-containing protein n=1 Tax=Paramecium tetraurelia TaxID=5888 RepID=A0CGS0_PARTE|nr:uncharacterized protein GSPATT00007427001 [Paramecium tetraurelia]CAK69987.1 unnamed protein product [Paramecium tetraurelia]|eukprot:XP_001437384.1 hypothetical protein (macronuclear) [Paramecium tetraurelia strain d4-2]